MPFFTETELHNHTRKPRNQNSHNNQNQEELPIISTNETDPQIPRTSKSTISSLFLSQKKVGTFRGLGCTASSSQHVSVPAVIRSSAEWEGKRVKKKKNQRKKVWSTDNNGNANTNNMLQINGENDVGGNCMVMPDVFCGPGIGFSTSDTVVVSAASRRINGSNSTNNMNNGSSSSSNNRGKIDLEKIRDRERERERERERAYLGRRAAVNPETLSFLDTDPSFVSSRPEPEVFGSRYNRHVRHPSPDGLAELMLLQNSFIMGGRLDRFRDWRLDIDHMSYEQLLELGEKIGYVSTGLKEEEIGRCVRKTKPAMVNKDTMSLFPINQDKKCTVCQEEYESDDELGKLDCGHSFHIQCIKQWLVHKNTCPVCKTEPVARS